MILDPDNDRFEIQSILLDKALLFTTFFNQTTFRFSPSLPDHAGSYPIHIRLADLNKYPLISKFSFTLTVTLSDCFPQTNFTMPNTTAYQ